MAIKSYSTGKTFDGKNFMVLEMEFSFSFKENEQIIENKIKGFLVITPTDVEYYESRDLIP